MAGEAQEAVQLSVSPIDFQLSLDSSDEAALLCVPHGRNTQLKVLSVGFTVGDVGSQATTVTLEWRDCLLTGSGLATAMAAYTVTNVTTTRVFDANDTSVANMADVLGTLIADLKAGLPLPKYTVTNVTRSLTYNEGAADAALTADQIGQILDDIDDGRIVNVVQTEGDSGTPTDRVFDADSTSEAELADIVSVLHRDLTPTTALVSGVNVLNQGITGYVDLWEGGLILNQGDLLNLEITNTAGDDKEGFSVITEFQVLRHSGG